MGVNWIAEVTQFSILSLELRDGSYMALHLQSASFFVQWQSGLTGETSAYTILGLDLVNWHIGVILLLLFLCKKSNRDLIADKCFVGDGDNITLRTNSSNLSNGSNESSNNLNTK